VFCKLLNIAKTKDQIDLSGLLLILNF